MPDKKKELGQVFTPETVAFFMAERLVQGWQKEASHVEILDAGAGSGVLANALVETVLEQRPKISKITLTLIELDAYLKETLEEMVAKLQARAQERGVDLSVNLHVGENFYRFALDNLEETLFSSLDAPERFDLAILNPPYMKMSRKNQFSEALGGVGVRVPNHYAAFIQLTALLLNPHGRLVAISPRSFTNGVYFTQFRKFLLEKGKLESFHLFDSRQDVFEEDDVLQEAVVLEWESTRERHVGTRVEVSSSPGRDLAYKKNISLLLEEVVWENDQHSRFHLPASEEERGLLRKMKKRDKTLASFCLDVSTGKVVPFRSKESLTKKSGRDVIPLLYPQHLQEETVVWPLEDRRPNGLKMSEAAHEMAFKNGVYILIPRISPKEQKQRIKAVVYGGDIEGELIAFENHLNVIHKDGEPLELEFARKLASYLVSEDVSTYIDLLNGHTQINAHDLRALPLPDFKRS